MSSVHDKMMSTQELADYIGVTIYAVRKWIREGKISYVKINNTVRFERSEVDAFIARNRRHPVCREVHAASA